MQRAGQLLSKLKLSRTGYPSEELAKAAWAPSVGKRIATVSRSLALHDGCLIVEVDDAVWRSQLYSLRLQILKNIESRIGAGIVADIEFRVKIPRRLPRREERPFRIDSTPPRKAAGSVGLVEDEASGISDPVLRHIYRISRKKAGA